MTRKKDSSVVFDMILVDHEMSFGKHYWELTIDDVEYKENLLLGVAKGSVNMAINPFDTGVFWGIQPLW